jgi:hypothetical protein
MACRIIPFSKTQQLRYYDTSELFEAQKPFKRRSAKAQKMNVQKSKKNNRAKVNQVQENKSAEARKDNNLKGAGGFSYRDLCYVT